MSGNVVDVVVVGAGPAGLAVSALLSQAGVSFIVLEQASDVGDSWRRHYERLRLHTPRWHSSLPVLDMPRTYPRYPSRRQVVDYLAGYARYFGIQVRLNERVMRARRVGSEWVVSSTGGEYRGRALVVATGHNDVPVRPQWPGQQGYGGRVLHSSEFKSGRDFKGQRVLVVGLGNSGGEIAIDLHEQGATPTLAVRSPVNVIPKEVLGVSYLDLGIAQQRLPAVLADALLRPVARRLIGDLRPFGLRRPAEGPVAQVRRSGRVPLIDIGTVKLIRSGAIAVRPGIQRFTASGVEFTGGHQEDFDAVVLATGFTPGVAAWLEVPQDVLNHLPRLSGRPSGVPGLSFCGFYVSPNGMLREIRLEAERIVRDLRLELLQST